MTLEKGTLILVDYTATIKDTNQVFETTSEEEAKKNNIYDPARRYGSRLISVGEGWVLKGVDEALANANSGDILSITVTPDKGFGEREANKVRMIAQRKLGEKADEVGVGDEIELDQRRGTVRYIGSGRVQVDFNHKYAGRTLIYETNILKTIDSINEKVFQLINRRIPINEKVIDTKSETSTIEVSLPEESFLYEGLQVIKRAIADDIFKFVKEIKTVCFIEKYHSPNEHVATGQTSQSEAKIIEPSENKAT
ncbi:MAG TPA: FKBP-type peptidyl-prolyl cis-trans isomerase [Nitrososphaeraceae archaeon]|nr:FKBP-type peptidyl-prolyl cis-trans isomerase [Nitrososphaeraceae archaeon]